ncbi:MAG: cytochrome-c peroxidase [Nitrospinae bacterium RIFCSPLOWO2_02_FULL_39_110]|nr:MAG: cytochrome-c peroxidase [Nitrospinae bacterium RIFCSPHIGHO2_12_FULL_39_42]OGW03190.1 MAG: cytochrome-c peroxidase [Nitrospinae bacterium RIFCSPHIGHO2_02_FULL_39_82]OGW03517.1 MAG: cytochrome-c peroxidase [Nitrospinae bacterium RIFCSPLOWO2_02_FULL_39_110]OGW06529.1 MAG: cytochrome-c peroxidase [Nitrospinae bacterium RIFCSPLOWO2_02_39_17]OGW08443.1 MAG: cytochrome-c peroxidase [Nitrospinae bacterium RIFCSPLOWO2_12_FULL_39_93]
MIDKLIYFALRQKSLIIIAVVILIAFGVYSFERLPIDAFPDVTSIQVQVISKAPGMSPVEVEQLVTFPLEVEFMGLPKKTELRSVTKLGFSVITVVFEDGTDIYWARQIVLERLIQAKEKLPKGAEVILGPIATGLGEVYQYTLEKSHQSLVTSHQSDLMEFRTLQDWVVRPMLRTVPGVADVNSLGGYPKQYQVMVDPSRLKKYNLTLRQVFEAIEKNNANIGGGYIRHQQESYAIRGLGLIQSMNDIEGIVVSSIKGTPIFLKDVADIQLGSRYRLGGVTANGKGEAVEGLVLMLMGGNSREIVSAVKERVKEVNWVLPEGVSIKPFYDRTELVDLALSTIEKALMEGVLLVVIVLYLFLRNFRGAMVVAMTLPLAVLSTFIIMGFVGLTANLMTLGGLAISLGMIADASIIQVENVQRHLSEKGIEKHKPITILESVLEVRKPSLFGELIIAITFIPLMTLEGMEGKMFSPLAFTVVIALLSSLILSIFVIPVLCLIFLKSGEERESFIVRGAIYIYRPVLAFAMKHRWIVLTIAISLFIGSLLLVPFIGREFVPAMDEGSIVINILRLPSIALEDSLDITTVVERELMKLPEVKTVVTRTGTDEIGTDPMGPELSDVFIALQPREKWRFKTKAEIQDRMREAIENIPGIAFIFSQPIQMRVDELVSGVRAQIAVKLFGEDMKVLQEKASQITAVLKNIRGVADLRVQQIAGQYYLEIKADRRAMARYGINIADLNEVVEIIRAGRVATEVIEGQRRFGILVRLPDEWSKSTEAIGNLTVSAPNGARIPLKDITDIRVVEGPSSINREEGQRRIVIEANVEGRDIVSFVEEGQRLLSRKVKLPVGYYVSWGGQFENQQRAMKRLSIVVPLSITLVFFLLFSTFNSARYATLILLNLPMALIGGIVGLWVSGQYLSVPASVGFIALFGVAVLNGIVLVSYINKLREEGLALEDAIMIGCEKRLRPVLMTALVAILGLTPLLFATGPGSEVQKPLATVVVGGLITSTPLTLIILPILYRWFEEKGVEF